MQIHNNVQWRDAWKPLIIELPFQDVTFIGFFEQEYFSDKSMMTKSFEKFSYYYAKQKENHL